MINTARRFTTRQDREACALILQARKRGVPENVIVAALLAAADESPEPLLRLPPSPWRERLLAAWRSEDRIKRRSSVAEIRNEVKKLRC